MLPDNYYVILVCWSCKTLIVRWQSLRELQARESDYLQYSGQSQVESQSPVE